MRRSRASSQHQAHAHSDEDEDESIPASYHTVSLQVSQDLLDLMHTLHTRAATIYSSWAEEQRHLEPAGRKIEADSRTLWSNCWCPLLQGKATPCDESEKRDFRIRVELRTVEGPKTNCRKQKEVVFRVCCN
nr:PREDICTED: Golgi-specific brefeldin A-resistance guanine nucleotide exchange factor 1-like [Apteryx mantelli mantelli]